MLDTALIWPLCMSPRKMLQPDDIVLLREDVFPVCSPDLYSLASKAVCRCRLLQEVHEDSPEIDWRCWPPEFGLPDDGRGTASAKAMT
jgi:hypothetical protein